MPATERNLDNAGAQAARRALAMIRDLQAKVAALEGAVRPTIAVAGMACRFPGGADDPEAYWQLLADGVDAITEVPAARWDVDAWYDPDPDRPGKMSSRWGGFLADIDQFDATHFAIARREAEALDPQHRLLLETSWHALEDAGIAPDSLFGRKVGIFVGLSTNDYGTLLGAGRGAEWIDAYASLGNAASAAAGRLAYSLGTQGPTLVVDTACSSSLVAVHLAIQSLRAGECDLAVAAGVNVTLSPELTINFSKAHMLAADGRCKPFDARADGYVRAEGCGVVVLRRLGDAGGGRVRAVVSGSAVGQDGRSAGLTAPSGPAQVAVVRAALADAGLAADAVDAVEAHGTGTALGDPIELHALAEVFKGRARPLWVGSVKSNIGHAEAAAGVAGLLKAVLMLEQGAVPASLHFTRLNPHIELGGVDLRVPTRLEPVAPRAVGVSSFGFSGTNAHLVLTAAPPVAAAAAAVRPVAVLPLAARSEPALAALRQGYLARLDAGADWPALAHTAGLRQARLPWRLAVVAGDAAAGRTALAAAEPVRTKGPPRLGFLLTGQGSAYAGMARGLLPGAPVLAEVLSRCDAAMGLGRPLAELFEDGAALAQTGLAQPALFALAVGLGRQLRAWGVEPAALLGHSVGEYAAVVLAGVLPLEDGARLIARRAALMQALPAGGGMAAVLGPKAAAEALLRRHPELEPAAWNSGAAMTVAGPLAALARLEADPAVTGGELSLHPLPVSHAFHSRLLEPMLDGLAAAAAGLAHAPPQVPVVGNLSGQVQPHWDAAYWRAHARSPVRFAEGLHSLAGLGCELLVELGPQPVLAGFARSLLPGLPVLPTLARGREPWSVLLATMAELHRHGADPDWLTLDQPLNLNTTTAPSYPFERQRFWVPARAAAETVPSPAAGMLGPPIEIATGGTAWSSRIAPDRPAFLGEHRVGDAIIVPGASHIALLLGAAGGTPAALSDVAFVAPLALPETGRALQVLRDEDTLSLFARGDDGAWVLHARAGIAAAGAAEPMDVEALLARCTLDMEGPEALYAMLAERGIHLGPAFRGIRRLWRGAGEAVAEIELAAGLADDCPELPIHPAALDACFQTLGATFAGGGTPGAFLPFAVERVALAARCSPRFRVHVRARPGSGTPDAAQGDLRLFDEQGRTLGRIDGLSIARVRADGGAGDSGWAYRVTWEPMPLTAAALSPSAAELAQAVQMAAAGHVVAAPEKLGHGLEALAAAYAAEALTQVPDAAAVDPKRRRLFAHLPRMAALAAGDVQADILRAKLEQRFGAVPEIAIAVRCGEALPDVLRGTVDPLSVLFAGDQAGFLYGEAAFARLLNGMVLAAVEPVLGAADSARPARILEIGAGTGALFQALRERVPAERWRYTFTDLSPSFLAQAAERFGADAATFAELDIEQDPTRQGFPAGSFDLIIAGNVLHATRDLAVAVGHARRLLAPGGVLVLLEAARRRAWSDLVFGLTDGWWRFEDTDRRPDHPLLEADGWRQLLAERFTEVEIVASPGQGDQIVAVARHAADARPVRVLSPDPAATALDASAQVLEAAQAALATERPPALRIMLPGGLDFGHRSPQPALASVAGLARVLMLEHPELDCRILDGDTTLLAAEIAAGDEAEIVWCDGKRLARRLSSVTLPADADFRTTGTHLVTGGLGGLGPGLARWLLARGAAQVLLLARRDAAAGLPDGVELVRGDVADRAELAAALAMAGPALRGVFHLAGGLDDGAFVRLDRERLARVYRAKIDGARLLDELTESLPLDAFVLFGSTAGVFGNPGQANHAGANAWLDALAWSRRARGLPALTIDWGAWGGAGAIAREGVATRFAGEGVRLMDPARAFDLMGRAIAAGETQIVAAAIDWPEFLRRYEAGRAPPFFDALAPRTRKRSATARPASGAETRPTDRAGLADFVLQRARAVLGAAAGETIPADQPLNELGLDSLMALELRKTLGGGLGLELPATLLFSHPSTEALTAHLAELLGLDEAGSAEAVPDADVAAVQAMSEAEMAALIEREFALAMADDGR